jgi:RNA polymerase sigma-70 factor (ECF subfamily)
MSNRWPKENATRWLEGAIGLATSLTLTERIWPSRQYLLVDTKQVPGAIAAAGDFEAAFREHFVPVYGFIAGRVGKALAEDLAAEVFVTAYRRRAAYQPERGSLRSWLYGIAVNVVRGHWRDEQQLLELDARIARNSPGLLPAAQFADAAEERVIATTLAPRIARALAALSSEQREVLLLHAWSDLSHEEIAAALGIARGTARSRLSRARAALRALLGEFDFGQWTFQEQDEEQDHA